MSDEWIGTGQWAGWRITQDHSANEEGYPLLVDPSGRAYRPADIVKNRPLLRAIDVARELGISRSAVTQARDASRKADYRGNFPSEVTEGLWDAGDIAEYKKAREKAQQGDEIDE